MKKLNYLIVFAALCLISTNTFAQEDKVEAATETTDKAVVEETAEATEEAATPEIEIVDEATEAKEAVEAKKEEKVDQDVEEVENPE